MENYKNCFCLNKVKNFLTVSSFYLLIFYLFLLIKNSQYKVIAIQSNNLQYSYEINKKGDRLGSVISEFLLSKDERDVDSFELEEIQHIGLNVIQDIIILYLIVSKSYLLLIKIWLY